MSVTTGVDWPAARQAVATAGPRLTGLLREVRKPEANALGEWDVAQLAVHISHALDTVTAMTQGGGNLLEDIWGLGALSGMMVAGEGRRAPGEMADRIDATVERFLASTEGADPDGPCDWIVRGTRIPLSALTCQMLNDLTVHGRDIALAEGLPWPVDRAHAALVVEGFLFPSLHALGRAMVNQETAAGKRARFEVRLRGGGRAWLRFHDGDLSVEQAPQGPVDCHLSVDPEAFLLVAWGRISQWPAIARGQLLAWGRKPWLGVQLRSWLRNP